MRDHQKDQKRRDNAITFIKGYIDGFFRGEKKGSYYKAHEKYLKVLEEEQREVDRFADESPATR